MKLLSFFANFSRNKKKHEYIFAMALGKEKLSAAVWYVRGEGVEIVSSHSLTYKGSWDEIISAADTALSTASAEIPNADSITNVIFGLAPEFVEGERIISQHLAELKRLCQELSLAPLGFVVIPEALIYLLGKENGIPQTAILAEIDSSSLTVSLFKVGKCISFTTLARSESISHDFETALEAFSEVEVLPSKIILYGGAVPLEQIRETLMEYPWKNKSAFLHFPKIEILAPDTIVEAIAVAGAAELAGNTLSQVTVPVQESRKPPTEPIMAKQPGEDFEVKPKNGEKAMPLAAKQSSETMFGFLKDQDVALAPRADDEKNEPAGSYKPARFTMPSFSLEQFHLTRLPRPTLRIALVLIILLAVLFGGIGLSLYWTVPAATVKILVDPRVISRDMKLTLDTSISSPTLEEHKIPGYPVEVEVEAKETTPATGKKIVGDPAKGELTIYNKTTNEKTFVKGTVLIGPKSLQFTLDSEVSVASVSDVFAGIAGKAQAKVTASAIGTDGNLPPSSDFAFKDFPVTSYAARNERALGGGTSREVQVVSKTDADSATKKLTEKLTNEARQSISSKLPSGRDLLPESIQTKMTKRVLSQEVGNEASQFETQLALKATATTYQKRDIEDLLRRELASLVPSDYSLDASTPAISVSSAKVDRDGNVTFQASVTAKLVPLLAKDDIKKSLVGKTLADVEKILRQTQGIVGYEVVFTKELPFIKKTMPKLAKNLNVEVQPR